MVQTEKTLTTEERQKKLILKIKHWISELIKSNQHNYLNWYKLKTKELSYVKYPELYTHPPLGKQINKITGDDIEKDLIFINNSLCGLVFNQMITQNGVLVDIDYGENINLTK